MSPQGKKKEVVSKPMSGMERLALRVSSMINHPIAQERREVTIHRLDTDGETEWSEIVSALSEAEGISMTHDDSGGVTLKWEPSQDASRLPEEVRDYDDTSAPF